MDIGIGDAITPAPEAISHPVLLDSLPAPQLRAYPKYTVMAEKFHAICLQRMTNTRMKDYFDLWGLLGENAPDQADTVKRLKKNRLDAIALTDVVTRLRSELHKVGVI